MSIFTNSASASAEQAQAYVSAILGLVGGQDPMDILRGTPDAVGAAVRDLEPELLHRPEAPGKWSITQVVQHLADSELVWGFRLRMVLAHDRPILTGYDQDLWAERLDYEAADPDESLELVRVLRRANLRLLERASAADLARVGLHSERGEESVEHLIRLYAGHDLCHLRQLARIRAVVTGTT